MTREEHISNLETIGCDGWTVTTEAYKSLQFAIEALEQEPCEDCISRKAVIDGIDNYIEKAQNTGAKDDFISFEELVVKALPSIQPKPKTGHWKKLNVGYGCSECSLATNKSGVDFYRFCPNCGAKMESEVPT